jgi:hypothetical protein
MSWKTFYGIFKITLLIILITSIVFGMYKGFEYINNLVSFNVGSINGFQEQLDAQNREFKLYLDNQARAHTKVVNSLKDEIKKLQKSNKEIVDNINSNNEEIKNIGTIQTNMNENLSRKLNEISDHAYKEGTGDYNEQYFKKIMTQAENKDGKNVEIPLGWAMFFPNREEDKKWKTGIYPIEYYLKIIQSEQKTGQLNTYAEAWAQVDKPKEYKNIKLPLDIKSIEFTQLKEKDKEFFRWVPRLSLGLDYGFNFNSEVFPSINMSIMGYGRTKRDLDWKFLEFGIGGYKDNYLLKLSPFSYNLGNIVPLISNTFIGPFIGAEKDKIIYGFGLSIPF